MAKELPCKSAEKMRLNLKECCNTTTRCVRRREDIKGSALIGVRNNLKELRDATTAGVQQREDCRDDVYNVYNNQKSEQSYLSIAAWCGDTGLITVGCGTDQAEGMKEAEGCCIGRATKSDYIHNQDE